MPMECGLGAGLGFVGMTTGGLGLLRASTAETMIGLIVGMCAAALVGRGLLRESTDRQRTRTDRQE